MDKHTFIQELTTGSYTGYDKQVVTFIADVLGDVCNFRNACDERNLLVALMQNFHKIDQNKLRELLKGVTHDI